MKGSTFVCDICGITLTKKDNLKRHITRVHEVIWKDDRTIRS